MWFGSEEENVGGLQYAYADTCVQVVQVKTYFFGILVKTELEQRPVRCIPPKPD